MDLTGATRALLQLQKLAFAAGLSSAGPALAHPMGDRLPAQWLEVELHPDRVSLALSIEAPDARLTEEAGVEVGAADVVLTRLDAGLYLEVDGARVPLERVERSVGKDLVTGHGTILAARWEAPVDLVGRHLVRVGNANLGDGPSWFRDDVRLPSVAVLHGTNLWKTIRGEEVDYHGRWLRSEALRRVDLDVELPGGAFVGLYAALDPRLRTPDEARRRSFVAAWREGRRSPGTLAALWLTALLLGLCGASDRPDRTRRPEGIAIGLLTFTAGGLWLAPGPLGLLLAGAALLLLRMDDLGGLVLPSTALAVGALAGLGPDEAVFPALMLWMVGYLLGRRLLRRPDVVASLLVVLAIAVATRGSP